MQTSLEPIVAKALRVMYLQLNIDNFRPLGQRRAISAATSVVGLIISMPHSRMRISERSLRDGRCKAFIRRDHQGYRLQSPRFVQASIENDKRASGSIYSPK